MPCWHTASISLRVMPGRFPSAMRPFLASAPIPRPCSMLRLGFHSGSLSLWLLLWQELLEPCWEFLVCASVMIFWLSRPWVLILLWKPFFFIFLFLAEQWASEESTFQNGLDVK